MKTKDLFLSIALFAALASLGACGADNAVAAEEPCVGADCPAECEVANCEPPAPARDVEVPCETNAPIPALPFPAGTHMGVTQGPGCEGHMGTLAHAYDFNVVGSYETANDLLTVASASGTVIEVVDDVQDGCAACKSAEHNGGWGNCVIVQLDNSCLRERYCHLEFKGVLVSVGQHVCRGTPLGRIGSTGQSTGPHLHWQRERNDGQSVSVPAFMETSIEAGCNPCAVPDNLSGCFGSENTQLDQCDAPPVDPCADNGEHEILNAAAPEYTSENEGCAHEGGMRLKASAESISPSTVRFHVRKIDDSPFTEAAMLTLYVGEGPNCGNPPNVATASAPVVVGQTTQTVDLTVNPYTGWADGETKKFWVGKSEAGFAAARATGTISIQRTCL